MGIYRCNHCKNMSEHPLPPNTHTANASCKKCGSPVKVYDVIYFVDRILKRYAAALRELETFKHAEEENEDNHNTEHHLEQNPLDNVSLSDTDVLANAKQHQALANWFAQRQIEPEFDYSAVDMSGYYDEAASEIGKNHTVFQEIISKINWAYRHNHSGINFNLKKHSQKNIQLINRISRSFYSHTLFSRYNYQKQEKILNLKLQSATPVRQFFNGGWLEWFALDTLLKIAANRGKNYFFSCARNTNIRFNNGDLHELDLIFLPQEKLPCIIECKTGEYRRDLDKYLHLRKRLSIPTENFMILVTDIDDAQAKSLSSMYDLTFLTINMLPKHLEHII